MRVQRPVSCKYGAAVVRAGIQCPMVGTVTGVEYPVPRANRRGRGRRIGSRTALWGVSILRRGSLPTGCGVPAAALWIIRSRTGALRPGAGEIHNELQHSRYSSHGVCSSTPTKASRWRFGFVTEVAGKRRSSCTAQIRRQRWHPARSALSGPAPLTDKSCRSSPGYRRRPLRHDSGGVR
jgi:hypothetical protein